jgi:CsoR family transcriptional regulator, copper-sensing transcriptional repressor
MRKDKAMKKNMLKTGAAEDSVCALESDLPGRKAVGVDPEIKASNLRRLRRIEGQIRGLQRMVEEDRCCADILTLVSTAQEALRAVARALMRDHLSHCAAHAIRTGSAEKRRAMYNDLLGMIYKTIQMRLGGTAGFV